MTQRLDYMKADPGALRALFEAGTYLDHTDIDPVLRELVFLRASQINGCAFCIAMHHRVLAAHGEQGDRVWGLSAWREASWYTPRERAALAYTEAVTRIADGPVSDDLYAQVREHFDDAGLVALTLAIATINSWNRFAISFRTPPEAAEAVLRRLRGPAVV